MKVGDLVKFSKDTPYVAGGTVGLITNKIWNRVDPDLILFEVQYECEEWGTKHQRFFPSDLEVVQ